MMNTFVCIQLKLTIIHNIAKEMIIYMLVILFTTLEHRD